MRDLRSWRFAPLAVTFLVSLAYCGMAKPAAAQSAAAAPPPPGAPAPPASAASVPAQATPAPAPPAGYPYPAPPPGYAYGYPYPPPPPGYAYPPYGYQKRPPPESVRYNGGPIPEGYHLEERPKKGLIISGALMTGIPWAIGLAAVSGSNFPNSSGWLAVPALGPWLTLMARHDSRCSSGYDNGSSDVCIDDSLNSLARTALVFDGLVQTAGAVLFIVGLASPTKVVARDFVSRLRFTPAPVGGQGMGGFLTGQF